MISRKGNSLSVIFSMAWRPSLWGAKVNRTPIVGLE